MNTIIAGNNNMDSVKRPIMLVAGTRPEVIKLAPVIEWLERLNIEYVFVWSGQHYDYEMSRIFFDQLGLPELDENLNVGSGTHSEQTAKTILKLEKTINKYKPSILLAEGDTNTVVATALTASKMQIPFAHLEAGLRSWDRTMPEELNRVVADALAEIHFAPTELAAINLMHEGVSKSKIHITGNTIVDITLKYKNKAFNEGKKLIERLNLQKHEYLLVTIHRQENTNNPQRLTNIVKALIELSNYTQIVFPSHPRTIVKLKKYGLYNTLKNKENIMLLGPLGYFQFLGLLAFTKIVLTDSGGVQEEACTLKIPTITLRYNTERPETVKLGINKIVGTESHIIVNEALKTMKSFSEIIEKVKNKPNPLGEGNAGEKVVKILKSKIETIRKADFIDNRDDPYITFLLVESGKIDENIKTKIEKHDYIALYNKDGLSVADLSEASRLVVRLPLSVAWSLKIRNDEK